MQKAEGTDEGDNLQTTVTSTWLETSQHGLKRVNGHATVVCPAISKQAAHHIQLM